MAHHVIPNAFKWTIWRMSRGQINVDDPKYGSWWKSTDHLTHARQYNLEWAKWLARNKKAGTKQILDFAREIAHKYGQTIYFSPRFPGFDKVYDLGNPMAVNHTAARWCPPPGTVLVHAM